MHYTKFGMASDEYKKYRPDYPDTFFFKIMRHVPKPFKRAVDLGAGTGISTAFLERYFEKVYAVEPDKKMLDKLAELNGDIEIFTCPAENIDVLEPFVELITAGNSFYWMKGDIVIQKVSQLLRNNGVFAVYRYNFPTSVPEVDKIISVENKKWDTFRHNRLRDEEYSIRTIKKSNLFSDIRIEKIQNIVNLKTEELIGFFSSTSFGSAFLRTKKEPGSYLYGLNKKINKLIKGTIPVDFSLELIIAKK